MSPAAKGRRAPSGSCVVAEGGPNSIRAEISRSHGTAPLVPMTPASAKPETGRPGGGYAPVGVGPTPLPRWQAPGGAAVSVLVCAHQLICLLAVRCIPCPHTPSRRCSTPHTSPTAA